MRHCLSRGALSLVAPALFLLFWHYASLRIDNAVVLPKIEEVLAILLHPTKDLLNMGSLIGNVTVSFVRRTAPPGRPKTRSVPRFSNDRTIASAPLMRSACGWVVSCGLWLRWATVAGVG